MGDAADDAERRAEREREEDGVIEGEAVEEGDPVPEQALAVRETIGSALSVDELVARQNMVEEAMRRAMRPEIDYGHIPGINKPTLMKSGAEKLCVLFQLAPTYPSERQEVVKGTDGHLDVVSVCVLRHIPTKSLVAEGVSYASSRETKYAYRKGGWVCPKCEQATIKKGRTRDQSKEQFYCYRKIDGCGATFDEGTPEFDALASTDVQRVDNPDLPDTYNTVLKMGAKRALIAAVLNATGASSVFTQDVEEAMAQPQDDFSERERTVLVAEEPPMPRTWPEIAAAFAELHVEPEWVAEAIMAGWGKPRAELSAEESNVAGQKMRTAYVRIYKLMMEDGETATLGAPRVEQIREGFASVLDGQVLEGPPADSEPTGSADAEVEQIAAESFTG